MPLPRAGRHHDVSRGDVRVYKTAHHPRLIEDYREAAWRVARATAAAPTYFPSFTTAWGAPLIDGGVWANNPAMVALTEAMAVLEIPCERIGMLSLGTTESPISVRRATRERGGKLQWAGNIVEWLLHGQSLAATKQASLLLGPERFLRISPVVGGGRFALDRTDVVDELMGFGEAEARHAVGEVERRFLQTKAAPFTPCWALPPVDAHGEPRGPRGRCPR